MKKIWLLLLAFSMMLMTACDSGLKIVNRVNLGTFTQEEKIEFTNFVDLVKLKSSSVANFTTKIDDLNLELIATFITDEYEEDAVTVKYKTGDEVKVVIFKEEGVYTLSQYHNGDEELSERKTGASLTEVLPAWVANTTYWNLTSDSFSAYNPQTIQELYTAMAELKAESNSTAMDYLFQAIIDTQPIEAGLREDIANALGSNLPQGLTEEQMYDYADDAFNSPAKVYGAVTSRGLVALGVIAQNLENAYKANETVILNKTTLTNGYNVILTPAHFKAMSGAFKAYIAQLYLISSYKFANDADLARFVTFIEETVANDGVIDLAKVQTEFLALEVLDADTALQSKALTYMQEGTSELLAAAKELPTELSTTPALARANMLALPIEKKAELVEALELTNDLMTEGGTTVVVNQYGVDYNVTLDLSKLYTLDIKALVSELLDGTQGLYGTEAKLIIEGNVDNSTFGGIFPNKIPAALLQ